MNISERIIALYRGWREWGIKTEGQAALLTTLVNDLTKSTTPPKYFGSKTEIESEISSILSELQIKNPFINQDIYQYTVDKLSQSLEYLKVDPKKNVTPTDIIKRGMPWEPLNREEINFHKSKLQEAKSKVTDKLEELDSFIIDHKTVRHQILDVADVGMNFLFNRYKWLKDSPYQHRDWDVDFYWMNMVSTDEPCKLTFTVNVLERLQYRKSWNGLLAFHEICGHVLHFSQLMQNDYLQEHAPHLLCIAVHTQDAYFVEGVAQFMANLVSEKIDHQLKDYWNYGVKHANYLMAIKHFNVIDLINGEIACEQAAKIHVQELGGNLDKQIINYQKIMSDPFSVCQTLSYHHAYQTLMPILELEDQKIDEFLRKILLFPYSPHELKSMVKN